MHRFLATVAALAASFFAFYTARLLIVTGFLRHLRAGGGGAYLGAVVFPLLAVGFGWVTIRLWGRNSTVRARSSSSAP